MSEFNLYQITSAFPLLMENDEITDEDKSKIKEELTLLLQQKSQNTIGYIRNMELTIEAMKSEEKRITEQRKKLEKRESNFKEYVRECMEQSGLTKIETPLGTLSIARNPISVEVVNENDIPSEYKQEITTTKVDKKAITDNFKETGEIIPGVNILTNNYSLRIK